jgi:hypothetical protein
MHVIIIYTNLNNNDARKYSLASNNNPRYFTTKHGDLFVVAKRNGAYIPFHGRHTAPTSAAQVTHKWNVCGELITAVSSS